MGKLTHGLSSGVRLPLGSSDDEATISIVCAAMFDKSRDLADAQVQLAVRRGSVVPVDGSRVPALECINHRRRGDSVEREPLPRRRVLSVPAALLT